MIKQIIPFCIVVLLLSTLVPNTPLVKAQASYNVIPTNDLQILDPLLNESSYPFEIEIWVMMQQDFNRTLLLERLPQWYAPIERYPTFYSAGQVFDLNYTISYSFRNFTTTEILEFRQFIYNNSVPDMAPIYSGNLTSVARYVPSEPVEEYLISLEMDRPTMVFIDTYTPDPLSFDFYYYNASTVELDGYSNARPYGATYQVSGGGHKAPLLWYDFSAGPSSYRGTDFPHITQMNSAELLDAMVHHLQRAIELRFLPSWIYSPTFAYQTVTFDYVLIDLTNGSFDFLSKLNTSYIEKQYSKLLPFANWTSRIRTYDYASDPDFVNILVQSKNETSRRYYSWDIVNYLQGLKPSLFNESTEDHLIIPIYLFGFPDDWLFDSFLGVAMNQGDSFSFVVSAANERWSDPTPDFENISSFSFNLNPGYYYPVVNSHGYTNEIVETTVTSDLPVNLYVMDPFEYEKFTSGSAFTPIREFTGVTSISFNFSVYIYQDYYWVVENQNVNSSNINMEINSYEDRSFGLTFVTMHEVGHAFGLSHPHDGFSWIDYENTGYGEFLDWLWDFSYSQMTYAHHYQEISIMDLFAYYRGVIPKMMRDLAERYNSIIANITQNTPYVPEALAQIANTVPILMENLTLSFTNWMEKNVPGNLQIIPYGKPADFFAILQMIKSFLIDIETFNLDIVVKLILVGENIDDYLIKFEDSYTGTIYYEGKPSGIKLLNTTYTEVIAKITRISDEKSHTLVFNAWNYFELMIDIDSLYATTPSDTFPTGYTTNSNITSSENDTELITLTYPTPKLNLPIPVTVFLSIPMMIVMKRKRK